LRRLEPDFHLVAVALFWLDHRSQIRQAERNIVCARRARNVWAVAAVGLLVAVAALANLQSPQSIRVCAGLVALPTTFIVMNRLTGSIVDLDARRGRLYHWLNPFF
jgi:multisubunit Na+/H+ antiporter MnhB subunit